MTKTITFNFTNPSHAIPQTKGVSLNQREITSPEAQRTIAEMNSLMGRLMARLKETADKQREYELIRNCSEFTASIDLPPEEGKLTLKIEIVTEEKIWAIEQPLSQQTAAPLNLRSLVQIHSTPPRLSPILIQALSTPTPTAVIAADVPKYKKVEPKKVVKTSPPTPPQGWFSRIIAWILSFFPSSKTPPTITEKSPLIYHTFSTSSVSAPTHVVAGIRPLRNGNNICFINAIFQALMNIPEIKSALIAAHQNKIARESKRLEELVGLIAAAETQLGTTQLELQEVTKDYYLWDYILPDAKYTGVYSRMQSQSEALLALKNEQNNVQASMQASLTFNEAVAKYDKQSPYLNDLRGFIEGSTWQQEDARQLLDAIFKPLIYLVENPTETTHAVLASLQRMMFEYGEEKLLEQYRPIEEEETSLAAKLASKTDLSPLPADRILRSLASNYLVVPLDLPSEKAQLQDLLRTQFTMQIPPQRDNLLSYEDRGQKGWYQVAKKQDAVRTHNDVAPEFMTLQLKRFRVNSGTTSKIHTEIELPQNNKVTLKVNGKDVVYEIQTLVQHSGYSLSGGHYFSYLRKEGAWVEANDTRVEKLDKLPSSTPSEVYMIFLKRISAS